jgi:hypothetical protein
MKKNKVSLFVCLAAVLILAGHAESADSNDDKHGDNFGSMLEMAGVNNDSPLLQSSNEKNVLGKKKKKGMNVHKCLWNAALRSANEKSIIVSDFIGGVLSTDWFYDVATPNERAKWNIVIHPGKPQPSVSVTVFKEVRTNGEWRDAGLNVNAASEIQNKLINECSKVEEQ